VGPTVARGSGVSPLARLRHSLLDVRATAINEAMKIAAAKAIAELAREEVPDEVTAAYGKAQKFGHEYIIPAPFDPRLQEVVSSAVARAAMDSGVGQKPIQDFQAYKATLNARTKARY
jgi:malate dehydrogenase (oxaloacetate-decarboxylating)(NADP+)